MKIFIKYFIYVALVVAIFFILKGLWDGELTKNEATNKTESQINSNTIQGTSNPVSK